ncbi:hypothetical protein [Streptomyces sp. TLI_105]|uniref:hypothetical protein n=1 Tax=Streptomyces sp. TLI_105 TaxID=1881019 RepID=UPI0008956438|nr:hypothetical protein [Streptomyces sp. TLI_105]SED85951.1 hypothetical protein SAMN05428939_6502 [Streptomyces sp. TLI_105]
MASPALTSALHRIDAVFGGMTAPAEGCLHCYGAEELALLSVPRAPLGDDLVRRFFHEVPSHFDDHPAVVRRLLPEFLAFLASGRFDGIGYQPTGLSRTEWQEWPREQAEAIEDFLDTWWRETLAAPEPVYSVGVVWELCLESHRSLAPLLDVWATAPRGGTEDRHLGDWVAYRIEELLQDDPFALPWTMDGAALLPELQAWLVEHAVDRLAGHPDPLLERKTALLALAPEERWVAYSELVASVG